MPFSYEQIEDEVVTRLTTTLVNYAVTIPLPDVQKEVDDSIKTAESTSKALVVVLYEGSDFGASNSTNQASQPDNMLITCNVRCSRRRGETGIMNMMQLIKISLQGYKLTNGNRMFLKEIKLDEHDFENKIFSYNITFTCNKMQVQSFLDGDDITGALLNQVNWNDKTINNQNIT